MSRKDKAYSIINGVCFVRVKRFQQDVGRWLTILGKVLLNQIECSCLLLTDSSFMVSNCSFILLLGFWIQKCILDSNRNSSHCRTCFAIDQALDNQDHHTHKCLLTVEGCLPKVCMSLLENSIEAETSSKVWLMFSSSVISMYHLILQVRKGRQKLLLVISIVPQFLLVLLSQICARNNGALINQWVKVDLEYFTSVSFSKSFQRKFSNGYVSNFDENSLINWIDEMKKIKLNNLYWSLHSMSHDWMERTTFHILFCVFESHWYNWLRLCIYFHMCKLKLPKSQASAHF